MLRPTRRKKADLSLGFDSDEDCVIGFQLYSLSTTSYTYTTIYIYMFWPLFSGIKESLGDSFQGRAFVYLLVDRWTCTRYDFFFKLKLHYLQFRDLALVFLHRKEIVT